MLTAHLPSGYVLARVAAPIGPGVMAAALTGAVAPDLDMIWFHLVDQGRIHHHLYWPHLPLFWALIAPPVLALVWRSQWRAAGLTFFAAIALHLLLDTWAGGIAWGWPLSSHLWSAVIVPATQPHWVLSFLLHWTFLAELAIWAWAGLLWVRQSRSGGLNA